MIVYNYKLGMKITSGGHCAVAVGFFDGVHLAHRELIHTAIDEAKRRGIPAGVFTFSSESGIKRSSSRIYTTEERLEIIESLGVDFAVVCDFSSIRELSGREFVHDVLVRDLGVSVAVSGFNFNFGKNAESKAEDFVEYMREMGREAIIIEPRMFAGRPLSSSMIREFLCAGKVESAAAALGAPFFITGEVDCGWELGRKLGFPTANLSEGDGRVKLKRGVYRCAVKIGKRLYHAVTNIGVCPTFEEREAHYETHVINYSGNLYGKKITLYFLGYLREERHFNSPEQLKEQIAVDKYRAKEENGNTLWQEIGLS